MKKNVVGPVHGAVMSQSLNEVAKAIAQGGNVDELDQGGRTPLFYAVRDGNLPLIAVLVRHGANPNAHDGGNWTPLHFAAQGYWPEAAELLLQHGATVDARDDFGNAPLWRAVFASRGRGDVIKVLLSAGADKNLKNNHNVSPLDLANTVASHDMKPFFAD
jgi:ankyrin repeat protein